MTQSGWEESQQHSAWTLKNQCYTEGRASRPCTTVGLALDLLVFLLFSPCRCGTKKPVKCSTSDLIGRDGVDMHLSL